MKDGADLKEDARVVINRDGGPNGTYEINIKKVQSGDAGSYSVVASNSFGKEECTAAMTVKGNYILAVLPTLIFYQNVKRTFLTTIYFYVKSICVI